jgi:DNA repair protein RadC
MREPVPRGTHQAGRRTRWAARSIREVAIRYRGARFKASARINQPLDAVRVASKIVKDDSREHFLALYLNPQHRQSSVH